MREYVEKALHTRVDCEPVDGTSSFFGLQCLRGI